jgi:hypothetical protein
MTSQFVSAADLMARVLGAEGYRFVVTAHPISSATPGDLTQRAKVAAATSRDILMGIE